MLYTACTRNLAGIYMYKVFATHCLMYDLTRRHVYVTMHELKMTECCYGSGPANNQLLL